MLYKSFLHSLVLSCVDTCTPCSIHCHAALIYISHIKFSCGHGGMNLKYVVMIYAFSFLS